jgi:3-dehydroquinate synthase
VAIKVKTSKLYYSKKLPTPKTWGSGAILIYDRIFDRQVKASAWVQKFEHRYSVKSGEKLKNIDQFPLHMKKILKLAEGIATRDITLVILGGGSVGDFGGFVASVLKRGVRFVQIPSTWLAAIDSSHGGKTGLNVSKIKNQVGTFYPANEIHLVQEILAGQPQERVLEASGEVIKISLLEGKRLWSSLRDVSKLDSALYWKNLPAMVSAKYKIVSRDPKEESGMRHLLNLGHTLGHVWESQMKIPHGIAVLYGVAFAIEWSLHRKYMSSKDYYSIRLSEFGAFLPDRLELENILAKTRDPQKLLLQDKKMSQHRKIRFIFLRAPGRTVIESVTVAELLAEMKRQSL